MGEWIESPSGQWRYVANPEPVPAEPAMATTVDRELVDPDRMPPESGQHAHGGDV